MSNLTNAHCVKMPFIIVPWDVDFLETLTERLVSENSGDMSNSFIVFPNERPPRYMRALMRAQALLERKHCILPRMVSENSFFNILLADCESRMRVPLSRLDRAVLLRNAAIKALGYAGVDRLPAWTEPGWNLRVEDTGTTPNADKFFHDAAPFEKEPPLSALPLGAMHRFLPWGLRLADLMEDFFMAGLAPGNYQNMGGLVGEFANRLLERLADIHTLYLHSLDDANVTTPGYDVLRVKIAVEQGVDFPSLANRQIVLAGFHALTGSENVVFRHLWEKNRAIVYLHTDPALATRDEPHWAVYEHVRWIKAWNARTELARPPCGITPRVVLYEGYDLHSQLGALRKELSCSEDPDGAQGNMYADAPENTYNVLYNDANAVPSVIALPDPSLLLPVLHHLPRKDVNVSMGYPLERSPLARLLDIILELQENQTDAGFHWRGMLELLRHPYLRMLGGPERPLQAVFAFLDNILRERNTPYLDPRVFLEQHNPVLDSLTEALQELPDTERAFALARRIFGLVLDRFASPKNLSTLADALHELATFLIEEGGELWRHFPLDAECLFRLVHHVVPELKRGLLAEETLEPHTLFAVIRETIGAERVPFEAEPLTGLQVLGMLETRLLRFKQVFILDAVETSFPGAPAWDPLLPDSVRAELGLPGVRAREQAMAYTFHRLIRSAETVTIFYQTGAGGSALLDSRKQRSRFVEELIWEEEKRRAALVRPEPDGFLRSVIPDARPAPALDSPLVMSPEKIAALERFLSRPVSPTALDSYLHCPVAFFYGRVLRLEAPGEIIEGDDPAAVGELLHNTLQAFFAPLLNEPLPAGLPDTMERIRLKDIFFTELEKSGLIESLPYHSLLMLREGAPRRLLRMLDAMPETIVTALEESLCAALRPEGTHHLRQIQGRLDRIDQREHGCFILDYKTGSVPRPTISFWDEDNPIWERMRDWSDEDSAQDPNILADLAEELKSVQLPAYTYLLMHGAGKDPYEAAFVNLGNDGAEMPLLGPKVSDSLRERVLLEAVPDLLGFLLRHMEQSRIFSPRRTVKCSWCSWRKVCTV